MTRLQCFIWEREGSMALITVHQYVFTIVSLILYFISSYKPRF